jgi:hypothetical protein
MRVEVPAGTSVEEAQAMARERVNAALAGMRQELYPETVH